jgi:hypothetical protein
MAEDSSIKEPPTSKPLDTLNGCNLKTRNVKGEGEDWMEGGMFDSTFL